MMEGTDMFKVPVVLEEEMHERGFGEMFLEGSDNWRQW